MAGSHSPRNGRTVASIRRERLPYTTGIIDVLLAYHLLEVANCVSVNKTVPLGSSDGEPSPGHMRELGARAEAPGTWIFLLKSCQLVRTDTRLKKSMYLPKT